MTQDIGGTPQDNEELTTCDDCPRQSCARLTWRFPDHTLVKEVCPLHFINYAASNYCYHVWPELGNDGAGKRGFQIVTSASAILVREALEELGLSEEQIKSLKGFKKSLLNNPGGEN